MNDAPHFIVNDLIVRFAAEGGDGSMSTGEFFGIAVKRSGLEILKTTSLPAEIKGGPAMIQIRVGEQTPKSQGSHLDVLVCFNDEVYQINKGDLKPNGVLIYDPECKLDDTNADATHIEIPFADIAKKEAGGALAKNMVALGAIAGLLEMPIEIFEEMIHAKWDRKGEKVVGNNLAGLHAGQNYVQPLKDLMPFRIQVFGGKDNLLMGGNDAIALGADAACRPALEVKRDACTALLAASGGQNLSETMWLRSEIAEAEAGLG